MKSVGVGVAVIVRRNDKILMGRRKGTHGDGTWSLPGGLMEYGETPVGAALRELREEIGEQCVFSEILVFKSYPYTSTVFKEGKHHVCLFFEANLLHGEPELMEPNKCERWEWFDPDHLPSPLFATLDSIDMHRMIPIL